MRRRWLRQGCRLPSTAFGAAHSRVERADLSPWPHDASCSDYRIKDFPVSAITVSRAEHIPIGELSRLSGVNIETIRYYERIKMVPPPQRTASGRRVYGATELRMLAFIRRSRELGFSLNEIRALLRLGA